MNDEDIFEVVTPQVSYSTGWSNTLGDQFRPTSKDVLAQGLLVAVSAVAKEDTEMICQQLTKEFSAKVDWYWWHGRSFVKAICEQPKLTSIQVRFKEECQKVLKEQQAEDVITERRMLAVCSPKHSN